MKIIITQVEIEEAIKAHVLRQITVQPNQNISINFKNTRGDDGATAEIDISQKVDKPSGVVKRSTEAPKAAPVAPKEEVEQPVTETAEASVEPPVVEETQVEEPTQEAITEQGDPINAITTDPVETDSEVGRPIPATQERVQIDEPEQEAPAARPAGSLFANLSRPKN